MGCAFSCKICSSTSTKESWMKMIRVVHLNGDVEYLEHPVMVAQVTGKPPKHLLFTHAQLLTNATTPLKPDALLEAGKVYFLLPHTLFKANVSPTDLAPMVRKLAVAANSKCNKRNGESPMAMKSTDPKEWNNGNGGVSVKGDNGCKDGKPRRPWKPLLSTIREISFNRRSESDLQTAET